MSGHNIFLTGSALIGIPRGFNVLYAFTMGLPWFFPAVGTALFVNLAYCAWRGERWAYYLLMFLCIVGLVFSVILLLAARSTGELLLGLFEVLGVALGAGLIALHPNSQEFMERQRSRFGASS